MNESGTKWLLVVAAAWNILGGGGALLDPAQHFAQFYTTSLSLADPLQLFFYRCTWISVIAWGVAYALAALLPQSRKAVLAAGAVGKSVYFAACVALVMSGVGKAVLLAAGVADLLFALLFAVALLWRVQPAARVPLTN
jgi:hypothetical protein